MVNDDETKIDQQIAELQTQLKLLRAKKNSLKHPHSLTMTICEAADVLGISRNGAYSAAKCGQIPTIKIGKRLLVPVAAMKRLLGNGTAV
jgi:excisionase family DNA binding protein